MSESTISTLEFTLEPDFFYISFWCFVNVKLWRRTYHSPPGNVSALYLSQALTANLYVELFLLFIHIKITKKKFLSDPSIRDYKVNKLFKTTKKRREGGREVNL